MRDLVDAVSPAAARRRPAISTARCRRRSRGWRATLRDLHLRLEASIDFPDEGYRFIDRDGDGRGAARLRDELRAIVAGGTRGAATARRHLVVVAGAPNVGKSSVFNALVGDERAIVTPIAGTTRDLVSEHVLVGDAHLRLVDTAGVRASAEVVEQEGIRRATAAVEDADLVLVVLDRSRALAPTIAACWRRPPPVRG